MDTTNPKNFTSEEKAMLDKRVLDTIRDFSFDTVYFKDRESRFIWNSKAHADQVGAASPEDMIGKDDTYYFPEEFAQKAREDELKIIETGKPILNIDEELEDGEDTRYFSASKYPFYDDQGNIIGTWGITREVTEQKRVEKELELSNRKMQRLARVDDLSGLYNRRYFYESLERIISMYEGRSDDSTFALISLGIDDMRNINDQYGQPNGDNVIRYVASAMLCGARKSDICFRIGGDEFIILLTDCDKLGALAITKKINDAVASSGVPLGNKMERITVSMGVVVYEKGQDISELISLSDRKLYKSKRNGKNQVSF